MSEKASGAAPMDLRVLEPDRLGALALLLYGRDEPPRPPGPARPPSGWRGLGRRRGRSPD